MEFYVIFTLNYYLESSLDYVHGFFIPLKISFPCKVLSNFNSTQSVSVSPIQLNFQFCPTSNCLSIKNELGFNKSAENFWLNSLTLAVAFSNDNLYFQFLLKKWAYQFYMNVILGCPYIPSRCQFAECYFQVLSSQWISNLMQFLIPTAKRRLCVINRKVYNFSFICTFSQTNWLDHSVRSTRRSHVCHPTVATPKQFRRRVTPRHGKLDRLEMIPELPLHHVMRNQGQGCLIGLSNRLTVSISKLNSVAIPKAVTWQVPVY